jgi:hypothetical protein
MSINPKTELVLRLFKEDKITKEEAIMLLDVPSTVSCFTLLDPRDWPNDQNNSNSTDFPYWE